MKIVFKVGKKTMYVIACDLCGAHEIPKGGKEIIRQSTISMCGAIPVYQLCKEYGKVKINEFENPK